MIYFIKNMSVKKKPSVGLKDIIKQQNWLANALIPMYCQFLIVKAIFMTCLNAQSRLPE